MYRLYCEACGWSKFTDGTDLSGLIPHKRSKVQGHIPKLGEDGKMEKWKDKEGVEDTAQWLTMPRQFKCLGCGRVVTARKTALRAEAPDKKSTEATDE